MASDHTLKKSLLWIFLKCLTFSSEYIEVYWLHTLMLQEGLKDKVLCLISTDLFTCESLGSGSNASITFAGEVSVGHGRKRSTQNHSSLCAEFSSKYNYLEIRFNHFYDVCAVTTWTKNSNHTLANFRIKYSNSMTFSPYYQVRAIVKVSNYLSSPVGVAFINYHLCQAYANIPLGHVSSFEPSF